MGKRNRQFFSETQEHDSDIAIRISHVSKEYRLGQIGGGHKSQRKRFMALDDICLTVRKGETVGILGRNGAGKSTLLKILSRITTPTKGEIDIYGRVSSMLEVGTGFHAEMTGRENIYLNGTILGMSKAEIDSKIDAIIEFSEIGPFIDTPVKRYSSGMYVRLAFAVAAHLTNDIMIMDEVLAVGDVLFRQKSIARMKEEAESGKTILYVSHNLNTIRQLCDRCIVLKEGKLIYSGETEKAVSIYLDSILVEDFRRDLSGIPRSKKLYDRRVKLVEAEYVGKESIQFSDGEKMQMRLRWENLKGYRHLNVRVEIWTIEDVLQSSAVLKDICDGEPGDREEMIFELDISCFAPGTYKTVFTFFLKDEDGSIRDVDRVIGLYFERISQEKELWDAGQWGYIRLDGIRRIRLNG